MYLSRASSQFHYPSTSPLYSAPSSTTNIDRNIQSPEIGTSPHSGQPATIFGHYQPHPSTSYSVASLSNTTNVSFHSPSQIPRVGSSHKFRTDATEHSVAIAGVGSSLSPNLSPKLHSVPHGLATFNRSRAIVDLPNSSARRPLGHISSASTGQTATFYRTLPAPTAPSTSVPSNSAAISSSSRRRRVLKEVVQDRVSRLDTVEIVKGHDGAPIVSLDRPVGTIKIKEVRYNLID